MCPVMTCNPFMLLQNKATQQIPMNTAISAVSLACALSSSTGSSTTLEMSVASRTYHVFCTREAVIVCCPETIRFAQG